MTKEDLKLAELALPLWKPKVGDLVWVWVGPSYSAVTRVVCPSWWRNGEVKRLAVIQGEPIVTVLTRNKFGGDRKITDTTHSGLILPVT